MPSPVNPQTTRETAAVAPPLPPPTTELGPRDVAAILAIAAHELKNALAGIGVTLARSEQRLTMGIPVTAEDLAQARSETRRLAVLVDNLLDGGRVDLGHFELDLASCDLAALAREVVDTFRASSGREVELVLPAGGKAPLRADGERLRAVLVNYLTNAARYAPLPSSIAVEVGPSPRESGWVRLAVRDSGPGIGVEDQARVFDRFFRAAGAAARTPGLGIGLYLCRAIATAHGGAAGVDSVPGAGATFWLDLPAPPA